jgi:hypothetical protein
MMLAGLFAFAAAADDHSVGPHKGAVAEWGDEEYHVEIVTDAKTGDITVYIYGDHDDFHKKKLKAVDAKSITVTVKGEKPVHVKLEPKPRKEDPEGKSSIFTGTSDAVKTEKKLVGSISAKVGTKPYTGDFKQK